MSKIKNRSHSYVTLTLKCILLVLPKFKLKAKIPYNHHNLIPYVKISPSVKKIKYYRQNYDEIQCIKSYNADRNTFRSATTCFAQRTKPCFAQPTQCWLRETTFNLQVKIIVKDLQLIRFINFVLNTVLHKKISRDSTNDVPDLSWPEVKMCCPSEGEDCPDENSTTKFRHFKQLM